MAQQVKNPGVAIAAPRSFCMPQLWQTNKQTKTKKGKEKKIKRKKGRDISREHIAPPDSICSLFPQAYIHCPDG